MSEEYNLTTPVVHWKPMMRGKILTYEGRYHVDGPVWISVAIWVLVRPEDRVKNLTNGE